MHQRTAGAAAHPAKPPPQGPADVAGGAHYLAPFARWEVLGFGLCMVAALVLRLHALDRPSLWMDEVASVAFAMLSWDDLFGAVARLEPTPPGYYALLKLLAPVTGTSDFALRLTSVIAATLALLPCALYVRRAFGPLAAMAALLLLVTSASQVHYAQQARTYAPLFLLTATALWLEARMLEPGLPLRQRCGRAVLFAIVCIAAVHLHSTAVFIIAALYVHAAVVLIAGRRFAWAELSAPVLAGLLILLGSIWWLSAALHIAGDPQSAISWMQRPDVGAAFRMVSDMLGALYLDRIRLPMVSACAVLLGAALALALRRRHAEALGLAAALVFSVLVFFSASQVTPIMIERTVLFVLVFALPLYGYALTAVRPRWIGPCVLALLLGLQTRAVANRHAVLAAQAHGEDWRGAVAALVQQITPGEPVLLLGSYVVAAIPHYAPGLTDVAVRGIIRPSDRLGITVLERLSFARTFDPAELCHIAAGAFWSLGRENVAETEFGILTATAETHGGVTAWSESFEQVVLRRWIWRGCMTPS